ncbi:TetR/AcrR family transcriptional regulator [Fulvivirgaceae bacterium BMA10]|uniref:TetR/AcrR family transcriptional regulator n=1 Tax=Splendidivirga corallicola TaxID=3051826 RepID=A0ABT8KHR8_9BACT|nr:TetR/AcrR family transcriptional regulator [Fulvivirgaceae bacterium BMA10]
MRPQKVEDKELLEGLMSVLRAKGYDGSSLNDLAASSGLQKASLYHRFPGGKKEITSAVLAYVDKWVNKHIYEVLSNNANEPSARLETALNNVNALYGSGQEICIIRALTMDSGIELFGEQIKESMSHWIEGFKNLGMAFGFDELKATNKAQQVLIQIQGSLVVSKGMASAEPFQKALLSIKNMYLGE